MRILFVIFGIAVLAAAGPIAYNSALASAGDDTAIDGESWTPDAGNVTTLDHSNLEHAHYNEHVDVYDGNNNLMRPGEDYVWYSHNGTVKAVKGGRLDGSTSASIDYGYALTTENQRQLAGLAAQIPRAFGIALPAFAVIFLLVFARGG